MKLTRKAYDKLVKEDIAWLLKQPRTLERDHIELILLNLGPDCECGADNLAWTSGAAHATVTHSDNCPAKRHNDIGD